jgi:catechol 2,3-dioxygenase-like lactoylglutathione lyase family enzyme
MPGRPNMMTQPVEEAITHKWYACPVFFVSDIRRAIDFYVERLGFEKKWHEGDGKSTEFLFPYESLGDRKS